MLKQGNQFGMKKRELGTHPFIRLGASQGGAGSEEKCLS